MGAIAGLPSAGPALGAAVDPQHLAGDEGAERAGEELDDPRDLVDRADPLERAVLDQARRIDLRGCRESGRCGSRRGPAS